MTLESSGGRTRFTETLAEIQQGMVRLGSLVEENLVRAGVAMTERRLGLVEVVISADEEINELYSVLERKTFSTLAREQPVAGDLRFLVSSSRMLYELERSGDLCVNCVKVLDRLNGFPDDPQMTAMISRLVAETVKVWRLGIDAMADMTEDAGDVIDLADDVVDDLVGEYYGLIGQKSEEIDLETAVGLSRVGRFMERIADHSVNIGENVQYIVTASFPGDTHVAVSDEG